MTTLVSNTPPSSLHDIIFQHKYLGKPHALVIHPQTPQIQTIHIPPPWRLESALSRTRTTRSPAQSRTCTPCASIASPQLRAARISSALQWYRLADSSLISPSEAVLGCSRCCRRRMLLATRLDKWVPTISRMTRCTLQKLVLVHLRRRLVWTLILVLRICG